MRPDYIYFHGVPNRSIDGNVKAGGSFRLVNLGGVTFLEGSAQEHSLRDSLKRGMRVDQSVDAMGEWVAVAEEQTKNGNKNYLSFSDPFGYAPLFYAHITQKNIFVVADSFRGIVSGLENLGVQSTLNVEHYLTMLTSASPGLQGPLAGQTVFREIQILEADKVLYITEHGVAIIPRSLLGGVAAQNNYYSLLEAGLAQAIQTISVTEMYPASSKRITLSGGVDSRLCLAILGQTDQLSKFQVDSKDPRRWANERTRTTIEDDVELANALRIKHDLGWYTPDPRIAGSIEFREVLGKHQSYKSNYSYSFNPARVHSYASAGLFTIRGGGGEILRSTAAGRSMVEHYKRHNNGSDLVNSTTSEWLAKEYTRHSVISEGFRPLIEEHVARSVAGPQGKSFEQHVNEIYFKGRNRSHFGHVRFDQSANDLCILPLSNAPFLRASELIDFQDRAAGRMVKDLFELAGADLLKVPFEDDQWSRILHGAVFDSSKQGFPDWTTGYDQTGSIDPRPSFRQGWKAGQRGESYNFDAQQSSLHFLLAAFDLLEKRLGSTESIHLRKQHELVISAVRSGRLPLYETVSKVASVMDGLYPFHAGGVPVVKECIQNTRTTPGLFSIDLKPMSFANDGWNNTSPPEHTASLDLTGNSLVTTCHLKNGWSPDLMYAFYLYKDGKRCLESWYSPRNVAFFAGPIQDGDYFAVSFVRRQKQRDIVYSVPTDKISVRGSQIISSHP